MNSTLRTRVGRGLLVLLLCTGGVALGDVSAFINPDTGTISGIILGRIIEDSDPVENSIWEMIRPNHYAMLNPYGAVGERTDGTPSIVRLGDGTAIAFWDYGLSSSDRDIVMSRWLPEGWTPTEWVSDAPELEYDPHAALDDDGAIHLAWWLRPVAGIAREVRYRSLAADGSWGPSETVATSNVLIQPQNAARSFRHADVAVNQGNVYLAYEATDNISGARWIEIAKRQGAGDYTYSEMFQLDAGTAVELGLHNDANVMWLEWRVDEDHFAYSVFDGTTWSVPTEIALAGSTWIAIEQVRSEIRRAVANSQVVGIR